MGYNNEDAHKSVLVFDCETAPIESAADFLEPPSAPSNYVKPEAIAAYVKKETAAQVGRCALDPDLCRVIALGVYEDDQNWVVRIAKNEAQEIAALTAFWHAMGTYPYPLLIGFNVLAFDLPVLIRRSQYLGVATKPLVMGKYRHPDIHDLMTLLNFDGLIKAHSLRFYAKRFLLDLPPDPVSGKDIGALLAADDWQGIFNHCQSDLFTTAALARRLGVIKSEVETAAF